MPGTALLWFREDLRLADNPALNAAAASGKQVLAFFVLDESSGGPRARGGAARWWLHGAMDALASSLAGRGATLHLMKGDAAVLVPALAKACEADVAFWNRRYDHAGRDQDAAIEAALTPHGCSVHQSEGKLLLAPDVLRTKSDTPFRVYTPYWRALTARGEPPAPLKAPRSITSATLPQAVKTVSLDELRLLPTHPDWAGGLRATWTPGEASAGKRLRNFVAHGLADYAAGRDQPARDATSRLSPSLAAGELSSRQVWHAAHHAAESGDTVRAGVDKLSKEVVWRDYAYHLLFHHPDLATRNLNPRFDAFPWQDRPEHVRAWQKGQTGYPIVDAGMRQLWQTGWMHNRLRLVTGSFLVKHLLIDWRIGEDWFWDTLCCADPANNAVNWQWIAGTGADAAPFFRIFNPVLQGERFDPEGAFVRRYVPELAKLPARFIHRPWEAPETVLSKAGVTLGREYPRPVVDHAAARAAALAAFQRVKG